MKKNYKILFIISMILITFLLVGCWDYKDIDKKSIVISTGIDRKEGKIVASTEILRLGSEGKGVTDAKSEVYNYYSSGKYIETSRVNFDSGVPYSVFLGATRVIVFGEELAKSGIESYVNRINSLYDYRKTMLMVISREPIRDLFSKKIENDLSVGFLIEHTINYLAKQGSTIYTQVNDLLSDRGFKQSGFVMPYIGMTNNEIDYLGLAIMRDSKMIDIVPVQDTEGLLYLLAEKPTFTESVSNFNESDNMINFKTRLKERTINTEFKDNRVIIRLDLDVIARLQYEYKMNRIRKNDLKQLEDILSEKIKKYIKEFIHKSQYDYRCDVFDFGKYFRGQNPRVYGKINWEEEYPKADIKVNINTKIISESLKDYNTQLEH